MLRRLNTISQASSKLSSIIYPSSKIVRPRLAIVRFSTLTVNSFGDTPLHKRARESTNLKELTDFVGHLGKERAIKMAIMVNNYGKLPIEVLEEENQEITKHHSMPRIKVECVDYLFQLMKEKNYKKLQEPISVDEIMRNHYSSKNLQLNKNLMLACEIGNQVRTQIKDSWTHAQTNSLSSDEKRIIWNKSVNVRDAIDTVSDGNKTIWMEIISSCLSRHQVGNCHELSMTAMDNFRKRDGERDAGIYFTRNGDHTIMILDVIPQAHGPAPIMRGLKADSVILDALNGAVFPTTKINEELFCYVQYVGLGSYTHHNVFPPNNFNFHTWQSYGFASNKSKEGSDLCKLYHILDIDLAAQKEIKYYPLDNLFILRAEFFDISKISELCKRLNHLVGNCYSIKKFSNHSLFNNHFELRFEKPLPEILNLLENDRLNSVSDDLIISEHVRKVM